MGRFFFSFWLTVHSIKHPLAESIFVDRVRKKTKNTSLAETFADRSLLKARYSFILQNVPKKIALKNNVCLCISVVTL